MTIQAATLRADVVATGIDQTKAGLIGVGVAFDKTGASAVTATQQVQQSGPGLVSATQAAGGLGSALGQAGQGFQSLSQQAQASQLQVNALVQQLSQERTQLAALKSELDQTAQSYGANSTQAIRVELALQQLNSQTNQTSKALQQAYQASQDAANGIQQAGDKAGEAAPKTESFLASLLKFEGIKRAVDALIGFGQAALQSYASNERLALSLQALTAKQLLATNQTSNMTQALEQAGPASQRLLQWTQKLAIESPFSQDGVAQAFKMAQAYGFVADSADKSVVSAKRLTQAMIDFASGSGQGEDTMQRIALALGQVQAKGHLAGGEMLQLTEAGLNVRQILADAFGKSTAEIVRMQERGLIPANQAILAIVRSLEHDFGGAAKNQSGTMAGLLNSLEDLKSVGLREFFTGTFQAIQPLVQNFVNTLSDPAVMANIRGWGMALGQGFQGIIQAGGQAIQVLQSAGPILVGVGAAAAAYAVAQGAMALSAGLASGAIATQVVALITQTSALYATAAAFVAANAAALAFAGSVALVAAAAFLAYQKWQEYTKLLGDTATKIEDANAGWRQGTAELERFANASDQVKAHTQDEAQALEALRATQHDALAAYAAHVTAYEQFNIASGYTQASLAAERDAINARGDAIMQATATLSNAIAIEEQEAIALERASQQKLTAAQIAQQLTAETEKLIGVTQQSADKSLLDQQAKQAQEAQTKLLNAQTMQAANAFLNLHPGITAAGIASIATKEKIPPLVTQLAILIAKTNEARNALAQLAAQAGIRMGHAQGTLSVSERMEASQLAVLGQQYQQLKNEQELKKAEQDRIMQIGSVAQQQQVYNDKLKEAVKLHGANSKEAYEAETNLLAFQKAHAGGGRGGGGGRADAAEKAGQQLAKIEQATGDKLAAIDQATQDKLVAFDEKAALARAQAARKLAADIATTQADMVAQQEANDLDLIGAKDEQMGKLQAREAAEAKARQAALDAQQAAQQEAANGDAETAQKVLDIRERQIQSQQSLDQKYYEKQQELAEDPAALEALKQQYDEATAANQAAADTRIMLAQQEAAQKAQAAQQERDLIIANAEAQKAQVVGKAYEQANGVANASREQKAAVVSSLNSQADAIRSWASSMESASSRVVNAAHNASNAIDDISSPGGSSSGTGSDSGSASSGSSSKSNAGSSSSSQSASTNTASSASGSGVSTQSAGRTSGGQNSTQSAGFSNRTQSKGGSDKSGNYPGQGSGGGASSTGSAGQVLTEASNIISQILQAASSYDKKTLSALERYQDTVATAVATLSRIADLRAQLQTPAPAITKEQIQKLADEAYNVATIVISTITTQALKAKDGLLKYAEISKASIGIVTEIADLREKLAKPSPALTGDVVRKLVAEVQGVTYLVSQILVATSEKQVKAVQNYSDWAKALIAPLDSIVELRKSLKDPAPVLTGDVVRKLVLEVQGVAYLMSQVLVPLSEDQAVQAQRYADSAKSAIEALIAVTDLRAAVADNKPALTRAIVEKLVAEAQGVAYLFAQSLLPYTEDQAAAIARYAETSGRAVQALIDVTSLRESASKAQTALTAPVVMALAAEARMVAQIVSITLLPYTQEQVDQLTRWRDSVGASVSIIKDVADLSAKSLAEYQPATDAQILRIAEDGQRIVNLIKSKILPQTQEQNDQIRAYAEVVNASVDAAAAPLKLSAKLFTDYQSPSDAQLNLVVNDAKRVTDRFAQAAATYSTDGLTATKAFAESVGAVFQTAKDGLLFFAAIGSGDFTLSDPSKLQAFEDSTKKTMDVAARLGAQAATIPQSDIAALNSVTAALTAVYESQIKLAAVPFENLSDKSSQFSNTSGGGGGGTSIVFEAGSIVIYQQSGQSGQQLVQQVAQKVMDTIDSRSRSRLV